MGVFVTRPVFQEQQIKLFVLSVDISKNCGNLWGARQVVCKFSDAGKVAERVSSVNQVVCKLN